MLSLILTPLGTFIGWSVIPGFLSSRLQRITYKAFPSYRPSSPAQASKHAKVAYVLIVCIYLIYTLVNSYRTVLFDDPNPYHVLDMPVYRSAHLQGEAWDALLKEQWRFLARTNHPDKSNGSEEASIGFVKLRLAYEILIDPTTRAVRLFVPPSYGLKTEGMNR